MTNIDFIKSLLKRLKKFSWLILLIAAGFSGLFFFMARRSIPMYTAKATVFPLYSATDNSVSTSTISGILGLNDNNKSFSGEASINIVELAASRRTMEAVAMEKLPSMQNKMISQLLIEEHNKHLGWMRNEKIDMPTDSLNLVNIGSNFLRGGFQSKISKNGILELYYTGSSQALVREITYKFIDKLSSFYIDLKKKKAQIDYEFAVKKADSLLNVLNKLDKKAVALDESTFFTNEELKRYSLPKQNLQQDKSAVNSQYYYAVNNREGAAYRLQKETPIIEPLDRPEPPYDVARKSTTLYAVSGFFIGLLIGIVLVSWTIVSKFVSDELNKAIEKATKPKEEVAVSG